MGDTTGSAIDSMSNRIGSLGLLVLVGYLGAIGGGFFLYSNQELIRRERGHIQEAQENDRRYNVLLPLAYEKANHNQDRTVDLEETRALALDLRVIDSDEELSINEMDSALEQPPFHNSRNMFCGAETFFESTSSNT